MLHNEYTPGMSATQLAEYNRLMGASMSTWPPALLRYWRARPIRSGGGDYLAQRVAEWVKQNVA